MNEQRTRLAAARNAASLYGVARRLRPLIVAAVVVAFGICAASASATTDSGISQGSALTLPSGHGMYFFVGSTSGDGAMGSISWLSGQDLAVNAASGNQAISIGHGATNSGSFATTSASAAIAGAGLDGYTIVQSYSAQHAKAAHRATRTPEKPIKGANLTLPFSTSALNQLVLIVAGGQGAGMLELTGVEAAALENATYGSPGSDALASAAIYTAKFLVGKHKLKLRSTTYAPNAGTSLGAVAYVLAPAPAPTVTGISPASGPEGGATHVMITGTDLDGATHVMFGTSEAQSYKVASPTSIEAVSPAGSGTVDVTVETERGTSTTSPGDAFRYVPPPSVTSVSPNSGPEAGGTAVTISGANLTDATAVKFGGSSASFKVVSPSSIEAVSPSGSGTVDVTVTTPYGNSATSSSDHFGYIAPPPPSISASKGGPFRGGYELSIQVHNFPLGTFIYYCHDNSGPGGSDTIYFSHAVEVTNPNQSSWPGVFCYDSAPYVSYLVMDGVWSNSVQF